MLTQEELRLGGLLGDAHDAHVGQVGGGRVVEAGGVSKSGWNLGGEDVIAEALSSGGWRRMRTKIKPDI